MVCSIKWTGRFGNNILQIIRCIHYCFIYGHERILIPIHIYLNTREILIKEINVI